MDLEEENYESYVNEGAATAGRLDRVLAVEIRGRSMAFAVIEPPMRLVDWGIRNIARQHANRELIALYVNHLLGVFKPSVVVMRRLMPARMRHYPTRRQAARLTRGAFAAAGISVELVASADIKRTFSKDASSTKCEIASKIADSFPEIRWRVPRPRRAWTPQGHSEPLFDAIAVAISYLARHDESIYPDEFIVSDVRN